MDNSYYPFTNVNMVRFS